MYLWFLLLFYPEVGELSFHPLSHKFVILGEYFLDLSCWLRCSSVDLHV